MKTEFPPPGHITENGNGIGSVTQSMVQLRASELAVINGRAPQHIWPSDLEQAHRELTGAQEEETDTVSTDLETSAWNPVPGSAGHRNRDVSNEEEEWQADSIRLVEEGVAEAEHDQMIRAMQQENQDNAE